MGQKKLIRFAELLTLPNAFQYPENMQDQWATFFKNEHPIVLELACGKGEYTIGLASLFPENNYIGVDLKGNRLWVGAKKALANHLNNVAFLRTQIQKLDAYFHTQSIQEIWLTFPDPQLRPSKYEKRLTHPRFLQIYKKLLVAGGMVNLKTDSPSLYAFTKKVIELTHCTLHEDDADIYKRPIIDEVLNIKTHYELLDIAESKQVHYLKFSLPTILWTDELETELKEYVKILGENVPA